MILVYRRKGSLGARDLTEAILMQGIQARRTKGLALRNLTGQDVVVCWGDQFAAPQGVRVLNNVAPVSKFREAQTLREKGVPTIEVSQTRPVVAPVVALKPPFVPGAYTLPAAYNDRQLAPVTVNALILELQGFAATERQRKLAYDATPAPVAAPATVWLPRKNNHVGGNDLLTENLQDADFYSKKESIIEEYRIHMFNGKSMRAGKKFQNPARPDGRTAPHQWIRSFDAGWSIRYDGFESTKAMRDIAKKAVEALGLNFAAVDIAKRADGTLIVLEVNRAPGLEGNTTTAYARKIAGWYQGREEQREE